MKQSMLRVFVVLAALLGVLALTMLPAAAESGDAQVTVPTPTALPDGRIMYKVQPGDSCISISLRFKVDMEIGRAHV